MDAVVPLKGTIANLNWFDAQRKHYETPDQIARRHGLPDDAGMRAFCQGAAALPDRHTVQFVRRAPGTPDDAWAALAAPENAARWLFGAQGELREGATLRFGDAAPGIPAECSIVAFEPGKLLELTADGGSTRLELHDASSSARARRDVPGHSGPITEVQLADHLPATAGVPDMLQDTTAEQIAQPGGVGTHCVGVVAAWHRAASALQKLLFEAQGTLWPAELAVGLRIDVLVAAYAKLVAAHHRS